RQKARQDDSQERQDNRQDNRQENRQERQADRKRNAEDGQAGERRRKREEIARDPSKTNDTVVLPVEDGAAVLDSDKEAERGRKGNREEVRRKRSDERSNVEARRPRSDADAQTGRDGKRRTVKIESADRERGERREGRPEFRRHDDVRVGRRVDNRTIITIDNRVIVNHYDGDRLARRAERTYYETLPHGHVREVVERPNGVRIVTIRNQYGEIIQRSRFEGRREYVLFYAPDLDRYESRPRFRDPGYDLPPMRLTIPVADYIIDVSADAPRDYRAFLEEPPVEPIQRVYTLDEVKNSARIRDTMRRIDLDTITFATGSAEISMNQASTLKEVADGINAVLDKDPSETFLIEGHTDAVGSDESNLVLSDERAEAVANVLTDVYGIPPENMTTQGYGESYLKVETDGPEQLNRRVTIRRVTPLVKPVASAE
ncbi:OmpA family protein, partial [Rhizobium sp. TRM95111]|uniref:OmpA family protein n=1 Tax=Rhizobium alarense TaxID=2846851 RepID=UPI001F2FF43D